MDNEYSHCIICGAVADLYYTGNKNLPLCVLASCEVALEDEINGMAQMAADDAAYKEEVVM